MNTVIINDFYRCCDGRLVKVVGVADYDTGKADSSGDAYVVYEEIGGSGKRMCVLPLPDFCGNTLLNGREVVRRFEHLWWAPPDKCRKAVRYSGW